MCPCPSHSAPSPVCDGSTPPPYQVLHWKDAELLTDGLMEQLPLYEALNVPGAHYKTASLLAVNQADSFFHEQPLPPMINYFVRSDKAPSTWKLLSGPRMTNATNERNNEPHRKRRYRVIFPPGYEDIYLYKSVWMSNTESLPRFFVELHNYNRYEPEPFALMGPVEEDEGLVDEAKSIAAEYLQRVFRNIEDDVSKTTRYAMFCESEYFSWDWQCKTEIAKQDMRHLINSGMARCAVSEGLINRLGRYLDFIDKKSVYPELVRILKRNIVDAGRRLERLRP